MTKFEISNKNNWKDINFYVKDGKSISINQEIKLERYTNNFALFSHRVFDEVFCFPIYNDIIFKNIKSNSDIVIMIDQQRGKSKLKLSLKNEHDIRTLSYGIKSNTKAKNINNIKNWLSKQLI